MCRIIPQTSISPLQYHKEQEQNQCDKVIKSFKIATASALDLGSKKVEVYTDGYTEKAIIYLFLKKRVVLFIPHCLTNPVYSFNVNHRHLTKIQCFVGVNHVSVCTDWAAFNSSSVCFPGPCTKCPMHTTSCSPGAYLTSSSYRWPTSGSWLFPQVK